MNTLTKPPKQMRFLQIGLGSMGKRRIRGLQALGFSDIIGVDRRQDRIAEAKRLYGIRASDSTAGLTASDIDAVIISTPPQSHLGPLDLALSLRKPAFVEVNLVLEGMPRVAARARRTGTLIAPSCTLRFHPAVKRIKELVASGQHGRVTSFSYHCGQYLPDWHPWEDVKDFFVSRAETNGCRELLAFELAWLNDLLGPCRDARGIFGRTMDVGADIDDTYALALRFGARAAGTMVADVTSRAATRRLLLNLERGQILWDWDAKAIRLYTARGKRWTRLPVEAGRAARGYHKNLSEGMYIDELAAFVAAVRGGPAYPNTLADDLRILRLLDSLERTAQRP